MSNIVPYLHCSRTIERYIIHIAIANKKCSLLYQRNRADYVHSPVASAPLFPKEMSLKYLQHDGDVSSRKIRESVVMQFINKRDT